MPILNEWHDKIIETHEKESFITPSLFYSLKCVCGVIITFP